MGYIRIPDLEFWWLAHRDNVLWLEDPDLADGNVRWADRDRVNWQAIATSVNAISDEIDCTDSDCWDIDSTGAALVPADLTGLGGTEQDIVRQWFTLPPVFDPWDTAPSNGRHRLWGVWSVDPSVRLPVQSEILGYARDMEISRTGDYPAQLRRVPWFDSSRGANRRFALTLEQAMRGLLPKQSEDDDGV